MNSTVVVAKNIYNGWTSLLRHLLLSPTTASPRGQKTKELLAVKFYVADAQANVILDTQRRLNYRFLVAQWLTTQLGLADLPTLQKFNGKLASFEADGHGGVYPSYGPRLAPQWSFVEQALARDLDSRQAVASIWEAQHTPFNDGDVIDGRGQVQRFVPCTLTLQFLLRPELDKLVLHTIVTMRSSDAWLGLPYDFFNFTMLANVLAQRLTGRLGQPVGLGFCCLHLGSSHLYERDWEQARSLADAPLGSSLRTPLLSSAFPAHELTVALNDPAAPNQAPIREPYETYRGCLWADTNAVALMTLLRMDKAQ